MGEDFRGAIEAARADLRDALAREGAPAKESAIRQLHGRLLRALADFGEQREGTRGHAWAILVSKAARYLERAATLEDSAKISAELREAEQLLHLAIADMNS